MLQLGPHFWLRVHVPYFLYWICAEPILSEKWLESFFWSSDNSWKYFLERTKNVESSHSCLGSAKANKGFVEVLETFNIFCPTSCINVWSFEMPHWFDSWLLKFLHENEKLLPYPSRDLIYLFSLVYLWVWTWRRTFLLLYFRSRMLILFCFLCNTWKLNSWGFFFLQWRNSFVWAIGLQKSGYFLVCTEIKSRFSMFVS